MIKPARWLLPGPPPPEAAALAASLSINSVAARLLWHRGYRDPAAARAFLEAPLSSLHDPFLLAGMQPAVERLRRAVRTGERILLYGDYDVDGSTSVVILKKAIELAGGQAGFHVPDRLGEGYGMRPEIIQKAAADGVSLIVSVDTGIRAAESVRRAAELGIDVIITDHHLPEAALPPALAVINPNRRDCLYPEKNLCGAAITLKLIQALFRALEWPADRLRRLTESFLKMVAIATVADVVPLTGENRVIVKHGLQGLRDVRNLGLRALLDTAGFEPGAALTAGQVGYRIAPRINAAGRMGTAAGVIELFLTADRSRARSLAEELHALNQERQQAEHGILNGILDTCARTPVTDEQAALVFEGEGWHRGVVGIVASRLVERFHRPVFVLSIDATGEACGSGRSVPALHLLEALESMAGLLTRFGGHRQAAGLSLPVERVDEFRQRLNEYAATRLDPEEFRPVWRFDGRSGLDELSDKAVTDVLACAPFGFGNPTPLFLAKAVRIMETVIVRERHLRVRLGQNGRSLWAKAWNFAGRLEELAPGAVVDVAFSLEDDAWSAARGYPGWSVVLRDVRPAHSAGT